MDDFSWGQTRKIIGDQDKGNHGDKEGEFDSKHIVMKRWGEFERERRWKLNNFGHSREPTYENVAREAPKPYESHRLSGGSCECPRLAVSATFPHFFASIRNSVLKSRLFARSACCLARSSQPTSSSAAILWSILRYSYLDLHETQRDPARIASTIGSCSPTAKLRLIHSS